MDNRDSYSVSLKLTLHNHLGQKVEYDIRKEYGTDDIEDRKHYQFHHLFGQTLYPSWKQYFVFYSTNPIPVLLKNSIFIQGLTKQLQDHKNTNETIKYINTLKDQSVQLSNRLPIIELATTITELHMLENPPEAIFCDSQEDQWNIFQVLIESLLVWR